MARKPKLEEDEFLRDLEGVEIAEEDLLQGGESSDDWDEVEPAGEVISGPSSSGAPTPRPLSPASDPPQPTPAAGPPSQPEAAPKAPAAAAGKPASPPRPAARTALAGAAVPAGPKPPAAQPPAPAKKSSKQPSPNPKVAAAPKAAAAAAPKAAQPPRPAGADAKQPAKPPAKGPKASAAAAAPSEITEEPPAPAKKKKEEEEVPQPAEEPVAAPEPEAAPSAAAAGADAEEAASSGGGWGGWGALGKLGASLQAAATTAVQDVTQLGESFQQVLLEAAAAEGSEEGEEEVPARPPAPQDDEPLPPEVEAKRREVLARLEGADPKALATMQAVDEQVGHLATGATKALSSLWGWGQSLAARVEEAASAAGRELADTLQEAQPALSSAATAPAAAGSRAGQRLGEALGQLQRSAAALLEGGGDADAPAAADEPPPTFDHCFFIYGGRAACEELEALSNECARLCNRARARLPEEVRAALDGGLAALGPAFALEQEHPSDKAAPGQGQVPAALAAGHRVVEELTAAGCERAEALSAAALANVGQLVVPGAVAEGEEEGAAPGAESTAGGLALVELQAEGVRRLSEVCSLCLERLVALGRSIQATFRYGRPADDGIAWPGDGSAVAAALRGQARCMVADLQSLAEAYVAALLAVGRVLDSTAGSKDFTGVCRPLVAAVEADGQAAICRVADSFKSLMHVCWCASLGAELNEQGN